MKQRVDILWRLEHFRIGTSIDLLIADAAAEIRQLRARLITADTVPQRTIPGTNIPDADTPSY
jgi:hypothetical protein